MLLKQLFKISSFDAGGECGTGSFKPCHPVWWLWWWRRGYVKVKLKPEFHQNWDSLGYVLFVDLSVLPFSLLGWTTMDLSFTTWIPAAPTYRWELDMKLKWFFLFCPVHFRWGIHCDFCLPVWRKGDWVWEWGSPTEFARGLTFLKSIFLPKTFWNQYFS